MQPDLDRILADLAAMIRIPSINPYDDCAGPDQGEARMAAWLLGAMDRIGLETGQLEVMPGRPNVWGRLRGRAGGPTLMLAGHTDTVAVEDYAGDPFDPRIERGRLYGRGACDMKGALAAMLETARLATVLDEPLPCDLLLSFVVDEEHLMKGSLAAGARGPRADACVVGEPTELGVAIAHKGQQCLSVTVEGRAAHSSRPELGENAIMGMSRVLTALSGWNEELMARAPHPLCGTARATVTLIEGGQSHSAVPGSCSITIDRRTLPGEDCGIGLAELDTRLAPLRSEGLVIRTSPFMPVAATLDTAPAAPVSRATLEAVAAVTGRQPEPQAFPGATDAPNFGCPAVICGPGALDQAHTPDEWIAIDQLAPAAAVYLEAARRFA